MAIRMDEHSERDGANERFTGVLEMFSTGAGVRQEEGRSADDWSMTDVWRLWFEDLAIALFLGCASFAVILLLLWATGVQGSPLPAKKAPAKPTVAPTICGQWSCSWNVPGSTMSFGSTGGYEHRCGSSLFVGSWQMTAPATLEVTEQLLQSDGTMGGVMTWTVEMTRTADGLGWCGKTAGSYGVVNWVVTKEKGPGL